MIQKNKKGQNTQMFMVIGAILLLVISGFAFSGSSSIDDRKDSTGVPDNSANLDSSASDYENRNTNKISDNTDLTNISNDVTKKTGNYIVTPDLVNEGSYIYTNTITNESVSISDFSDYSGKLGSGDIIKRVWYNTEYDVNGFNKNFQAILIFNSDWNKYKLLWSIENEDFVIKDLDEYTSNEVTDTFGNEDGISTTLGTGLFISENETLFVNTNTLTPEGIKEVNSMIKIDENSNLNIVKNIDRFAGNCGSMAIVTTGFNYNLLSNNNFQDTQFQLICSFMNNPGGYASNLITFSVNEYKDFSYDRIAENSDTRTTGFNQISFIKQERTTGINSMSDKRTTLLSKEKYDEVLDYANAQSRLSNFALNNAKDLMSVTKDSPISLYASNHDTTNWINYGLGTADSEDIEGIVGIDIEGYISDVTSSDFIEVTNIDFDSSNSMGLRMSDLGSSTIGVKQAEGSVFGKIKMDSSNSSIDFVGTARAIDVSKWDNAYASLVNIFDTSFSWDIWWNEVTTNSEIGLSDDVIADCDITTGCEYGYSGSFSDSGTRSLTLTTTKPVTELLSYNGDNYWLFWVLDTKSENTNGCLIFDHTISDLGINIPVSICDNHISGANAFAQFKIFSKE